jgi:hypothetical protein
MKKGLFPPGTSFKAYLPSPDRRHNAVARGDFRYDLTRVRVGGLSERPPRVPEGRSGDFL